jgi:hypothetical protein
LNAVSLAIAIVFTRLSRIRVKKDTHSCFGIHPSVGRLNIDTMKPMPSSEFTARAGIIPKEEHDDNDRKTYHRDRGAFPQRTFLNWFWGAGEVEFHDVILSLSPNTLSV